MAQVGRPKEYRNAAEKQRAYRQRQKLEKQLFAHQEAVFDLIESKIVTLRKNMEWHLKKTSNVYLVVNRGIRNPLHHKVLVTGTVKGLVEDVVFQYLLMTDQIVFQKKLYGEDYYQFRDFVKEDQP